MQKRVGNAARRKQRNREQLLLRMKPAETGTVKRGFSILRVSPSPSAWFASGHQLNAFSTSVCREACQLAGSLTAMRNALCLQLVWQLKQRNAVAILLASGAQHWLANASGLESAARFATLGAKNWRSARNEQAARRRSKRLSQCSAAERARRASQKPLNSQAGSQETSG